MRARQGALLVLLKLPEPGRVKTRLAAVVGAEEAAKLYRGWIAQVFGCLQPLRETTELIAYFDGGSAEAFRAWWHLADDWQAQPGGSLGERLEHGFALARRAGGPVVALGTDCLELDIDLMSEAFRLLREHDAIFGPAPDGGYYLVGQARPLPGFFDGIRWSSEHTLEDHLTLCRTRGWSVGMLPPRHDIDTWDDWQAYLRRQGSER